MLKQRLHLGSRNVKILFKNNNKCFENVLYVKILFISQTMHHG